MKKENHKKDLSQQKEELYKKWENTGIFDNLRGGLKENISKLYECCSRTELEKNDIIMKLPDVIGTPILARIEHMNDLGKSKWYEVVYYDDGWHSYTGSKTFQDGEQVVEWKYCKDCL